MGKRSFSLIAAFALLCAISPARADWPERAVRFVVPYTAGSMGDTLARLWGQRLQAELGKPFIVDNRPGAAGNIGARAVEQAKPDGYTFLMAATNNLVINQFLYRDMGYDPLVRFDPVTVLVDVPSVIFVNATVPADDFQEFVAYARAHPDQINYGSPGNGTTPHLSAETINRAFRMGMTHIPYKGASAGIQALMANEVHFYLGGVGLGSAFLKEGRLRALAVSSSTRLRDLPDTPTFAEAGIRIDAMNWWAVVAPKGTPKPVIERLQAALRRPVTDEGFREQLTKLGVLPVLNTPDEMSAQLAAQAQFWKRELSTLGVRIE